MRSVELCLESDRKLEGLSTKSGEISPLRLPARRIVINSMQSLSSETGSALYGTGMASLIEKLQSFSVRLDEKSVPTCD